MKVLSLLVFFFGLVSCQRTLVFNASAATLCSVGCSFTSSEIWNEQLTPQTNDTIIINAENPQPAITLLLNDVFTFFWISLSGNVVLQVNANLTSSYLGVQNASSLVLLNSYVSLNGDAAILNAGSLTMTNSTIYIPFISTIAYFTVDSLSSITTYSHNIISTMNVFHLEGNSIFSPETQLLLGVVRVVNRDVTFPYSFWATLELTNSHIYLEDRAQVSFAALNSSSITAYKSFGILSGILFMDSVSQLNLVNASGLIGIQELATSNIQGPGIITLLSSNLSLTNGPSQIQTTFNLNGNSILNVLDAKFGPINCDPSANIIFDVTGNITFSESTVITGSLHATSGLIVRQLLTFTGDVLISSASVTLSDNAILAGSSITIADSSTLQAGSGSEIVTPTLNVVNGSSIIPNGPILVSGSLYNSGNIRASNVNSITVDGNFTQTSTGTFYAMGLGSAGSNGSSHYLTVNGSAVIAGSLQYQVLELTTTEQKIEVIYSEVLSGNFSNNPNDVGQLNVEVKVEYTPQAVILTLPPTKEPAKKTFWQTLPIWVWALIGAGIIAVIFSVGFAIYRSRARNYQRISDD